MAGGGRFRPWSGTPSPPLRSLHRPPVPYARARLGAPRRAGHAGANDRHAGANERRIASSPPVCKLPQGLLERRSHLEVAEEM